MTPFEQQSYCLFLSPIKEKGQYKGEISDLLIILFIMLYKIKLLVKISL